MEVKTREAEIAVQSTGPEASVARYPVQGKRSSMLLGLVSCKGYIASHRNKGIRGNFYKFRFGLVEFEVQEHHMYVGGERSEGNWPLGLGLRIQNWVSLVMIYLYFLNFSSEETQQCFLRIQYTTVLKIKFSWCFTYIIFAAI